MAVQVQVRERVGFHRDTYSTLVKSLIRQRKTGEFCDVLLRLNRRTYPAHRAVLAASSPFFRSMFSASMKEEKSGDVDLTKSLQLDNDDSFKQVIDFMYSGDLEINIDNCEDVLRVADFLLLEEVKEYCRQFYVVHGNLNLSNCLWLSVLAEHHNLTEVARLAKSIIRCRFHDFFVHSDEIVDLPSAILSRLLADNDVVRFTSARNLASGVMRWARQNSSSADNYECLRQLVTSLSELSPSVLDECSRYMIETMSSSLSKQAQSSGEERSRLTDSPIYPDMIAYSNLAYESSVDEDVINPSSLCLFSSEDETLIAMNCNTAMKFLRLFIYRVSSGQWYSLPVHTDAVLRTIPARLNVCAVSLNRAVLYMFLSFNLPYPTDIQRLHIMAFDLELGRLALLTFRHRNESVSAVRQTTLTDDRSVPPAMVHCAGFICIVGNVDGAGHLFVADMVSLTYECHRIPGTRFVSLARMAVNDDGSKLFIWCRHRFGHEGYCVNREVSFVSFSVTQRNFVVTEWPAPAITYVEFGRLHVLCVDDGRAMIHTPGKNSIVLHEVSRQWQQQTSGLSREVETFPPDEFSDAPYRGHSLLCHALDCGMYLMTNPSPYVTFLSSLKVNPALTGTQQLMSPPIDGIALAACGALPSAVFSALPLCERFDESFSRLIHKKTKQLYESTDTEGESGGGVGGGATGNSSSGKEEEDYDGFEYDDDIYGYFDDYEYERNIDEL